MGFLNEEPVLTPRLDAFARESLVLPQAVSRKKMTVITSSLQLAGMGFSLHTERDTIGL